MTHLIRGKGRGLVGPLLVLMSVALTGCIEDGYSADCPKRDDYLNQDGELDFKAYRAAAVEVGCMSPVGGNMAQGGSES